MKELVREKGLDLTEKPVKRSTPVSVAHLMPEHQRENLVDDTPEPAVPELDVEKIRSDFPMIGDIIYLDNGATSFSPQSVITAAAEFDQNYRANVGRGVHRLSKIATQKYWHAHRKVAKFINGEAGTVVFTKNSTEALNMVARGFPFKEGDTVVATILEHHSNLLPWRALAAKGVNLRIVGIRDDFTLDMDELRTILDEDKSVRLVTVTHASNVTGTVTPVEEIGRLCKEKGVALCVDGAQAAPHRKVDVEALGADYYIFSGHKMLGPTGTGVLWMREEILEPLFLGGGMVESVSDDSFVPASGYTKYEAGTPNVSGGIGLGAAVDYLENVGMDAVSARERKLTDLLIDGLEKIEGVTVYACRDADARVGAVSFSIEGVHPHEVSAWLDEEHGIAVRSGMHCAEPLMRRLGVENGTVRATVSFYNTESEINTLVSVIRELLA